MSFWDGIIGISQLKSLVQVIGGDAEGARKTQENFLNQAPMISQYKSLYHAIAGDNEAARKTQEIFLHNTIEAAADGTPIVGHIKGGVHIALGDQKRGEDIIKSSTSSTGMVVGGIVGGPAGAIAGGTAMDAIITGVDSAIQGEYRPFGLIDYASNIDDFSAGEHFDAIAGLAVAAAGSSAKVKNSISRNRPKAGGRVYSSGARVAAEEGTSMGKHIAGREAAKYGANEGAPTREYISKLKEEMASEREAVRAAEVLARQFEGSPMDFFRKGVGLEEPYLRVLREWDFSIVNDVMGRENCYLCALAADLGTTVTELGRKLNLDPRKMNSANRPTYLELYRRAGELFRNNELRNAQIEFRGTYSQYKNWVNRQIRIGECIDFTMAHQGSEFVRNPALNVTINGHITKARAFKLADGQVRTLIIDYQAAPHSKLRFLTDNFLSRENIFNIEIISPIETSEIAHVPNLNAHLADMYRVATENHANQIV